MKIRTKLVIVTITGVFFSIMVSVSISSFVIFQQNNDQNADRIKNARDAIQKILLAVVELMDKNFNNALQEKGNFAAIVDGPDPIFLLETNANLSQQLIKIGLINNSDYAFYSSFGRAKGKERLSYYNGIKRIVIGNKALHPLEFGGFRFIPIKEQVAPIPTPDQVAEGYSFQSHDQELFLMLKAPFIYQGEQRPSGMTSGLEIGQFIFKKTVGVNLQEQGRFLGVIINIYGTDGKILIGSNNFQDIDIKNTPQEERFTLTDKEGNRFDSLLSPILFQGKRIGFIAINIPKVLTVQKVWETAKLLLISGLFIATLIGLTSYFLIFHFTKPLLITAQILNKIADKGGDLTQRLSAKGADELSIVAKSFNRFITKVQQIIQKIQQSSDVLAVSSTELATSSIDMSHTANEISTAIDDGNEAIQKGSSATIEMVNSLNIMFDKIKNIHAEAIKARDIALHGSKVIKKTEITMNDIAENTKKITGVVEVITNIAKQTNLLSLNAAIEAAKAGENGKGFAVVASEVRTLAEKSAQQVVEIKKLVDISRNDAQSGTTAIQATQKVFANIQNGADSVLENVNEVTSDITHQESSFQVVLKEMNRISKLSEENSSSVIELSQTLSQTQLTTNKLSGLADDIAHSINEFQV